MNKSDQIADSGRQMSLSRWDSSPWFRISLTTVFVLGIFFRLIGLGTKIYSHDEAYTSLSAAGYLGGEAFASLWDGQVKTVEDIQIFVKPNEKKGIGDTISRYALYEPHEAPLFFILAHYWMRIVGYTPAAMRSLAALFGFLSIAAIFWLSRELFQSSRTALLATALFTISPFQILFSQDARSYSLWALITILSSAALFWAIRKNNRIIWMTYSFFLIIGVYSHQLFILVSIVHGLYFLGLYVISRNKGFGRFLCACLLAILAYTPWLYFFITRWQYVTARMDWVNMSFPWYRYIQRWVLIFSSPIIDLDFQAWNLLAYFLRALILAGVAYALLFLAMRASKPQKMFFLLMYLITVGSLIGPDLLLGGIRSIKGRYFVPANMATILVMAYFLSSKLDQLRSQGKWKILTGLLFIVSIVSNTNSLFSETWWNKELSRVRPEFVHEINKDQSLLIVSGYYPTNLGDVLLLSLEVDPDVHFRLYEDPSDIAYLGNYSNIYWFPSSYQEVEQISTSKGFQVSEVLPGTLWQINSINEK